MRIAVIIPTLNESNSISNTLKPLQSWRRRGHQIILVDAASNDGTVQKTDGLVDIVLTSRKGRAVQMNMGAEQADAEVLLFLHADTVIDEMADQQILTALSNDHCWGRFNVAFSSNKIIFKIIALMMNLRSCVTSIATGDQAIFVKKEFFEQVGRYPLLPLMEDIQLSILLKNYGRCFCLKSNVTTSSRRWEQKGVVKTVLLMWWLRFAYFIGVPVNRLKKWYR
ncbi:MAG: TIGR04283 family arsenosugar biosynthesis glycosyltransferase [Gammaproteobacteria bacterium]|nr:TIGR04283 family arsenosugar biosynthesis glycosyltransferase [Gammaproteobacteria bacterium]